MGAAAPALPPAPEWREDLSNRLQQFRQRRATRREAPLPAGADTVPQADKDQKVLPFEDFAAERIEPLIVDLARTGRRLPPLDRPAAVPLQPPAEAAEILPAVAPLPLRGLAGLLDLAVVTVAAGVFLGTFHSMGGAVAAARQATVGFSLAAAALAGFYFFVYVCYSGETPGLQWLGLRVVDLQGHPPARGPLFARALGGLLSAAALGMGYLWAVADEEGLTWHDRMSKTFVTRDPRAPLRFRRRG